MTTTEGTKTGAAKRVRCAPCKTGKSPETTALTLETNPRCRYCGCGFEGRYLTLAQVYMSGRGSTTRASAVR